MKLEQKAFVVVSISIVLLTTLFLSFLRPALMEESIDIDKDIAAVEVKRINDNIQTTLNNLGKINRDWSNWDETYNFMIDQNPFYTQRNLEPETLANLNINYIIYIDSQNKPKLQLGYDLENNEIITLQNDFFKEFIPAIENDDHISKELFVTTKNGFSLASIESIYQSSRNESSVGTLIIGKYLDEQTINGIGEERIAGLVLHEVKSIAKPQKQVNVEVVSEHQMKGSISLKDYSKKSILEISFNIDRSFYIEKKKTVNNIAISLVLTGIIFVFLTIILLNRFIVNRIRNISEQLHDIHKEGNMNSRILYTKKQHDEISKLEVSINQVLSSLEEKHNEVIQLALYDHLTGLPNRYAFYKEFDRRTEASAEELIVLFLDLDGFKQVNDTFGHEIGDQLLKDLSLRIQLITKERNGLVARYGGDEFLVLFDQMNLRELEGVVQQILEDISGEYKYTNFSAFVTASIGICLYPRDGTTIEQVLNNADKAMYHAKDKGKNQYVFFHDLCNK